MNQQTEQSTEQPLHGNRQNDFVGRYLPEAVIVDIPWDKLTTHPLPADFMIRLHTDFEKLPVDQQTELRTMLAGWFDKADQPMPPPLALAIRMPIP